MKLTSPARPAAVAAARCARPLAGSRFACGAALLLALPAVTPASAALGAPASPAAPIG